MSLTSRKDTMVTADASARPDVISHSPPSQHIHIAADYEAQRRLQALDESRDGGGGGCDSAPRDVCWSLSSKTLTTRRPTVTVFNAVDMDELGPWLPSVTAEHQHHQQQLSHSGKTNRPRLIAEVITAHIFAFVLLLKQNWILSLL